VARDEKPSTGGLFLPGLGMDGVPEFHDGLNTRYFCSSSPT
jgi:hypothetical protein